MLKVNNLIKKAVFFRIAILILIALIYECIPEVKSFINQMIFYLSMDNSYAMQGYLQSFGRLSALISILLMVVQAVVFPLPFSSLVLENAQVFGIICGFLISWVGLVIGTTICFVITRIYIRRFLKFNSKKFKIEVIRKVDIKISKFGFVVEFILRIIPQFPFDLFSYIFGITGINYKKFIITNVVGSFLYLLVVFK